VSLLALPAILAACGSTTAALTTTTEPPASVVTAPPTTAPATSPTASPVTSTVPSAPKRPPGVPPGVPMPDPALTPGAIQSSDTAAICTPGWASAHRDVSSETEDAVAAEYGLSSHDGYEIDHLIPLELGGSNTMANLWPEPYGSPYGAIEKDGLEDYLHEQVCDGALPLATAQRKIAGNWYTAWVAAGRPMPSWFGYSNSPPGGSGSPPTTAASSTTVAPPSTGAGAWCDASASPANDGYPGDYHVYVHSNQPNQRATASDSGDTYSYYTDDAGYVVIDLWNTSSGEAITVTVGAARCSTSA